MQNKLTQMLGIEYPIIQGGMMHIAGAELVAAVSNAGGLGTLGQRVNVDDWHEQIKKTKESTEKPYAVNLPMHVNELEKRINIIIDERVPVVVTAAGNPASVMETLRAAGMKIMHVVASIDQARKVGDLGVDAIVAEGGESGGMVARDRVSTTVLVPAAVNAVKAPVVAAGGIADARGLIAAMAFGAQGVQMGTRFIATPECDANEEWKNAIIKARDTDTLVVPRGPAQGRMLKEEILPGVMAGVVVGMINKIENVKEIIDNMVKEVEPALKNIEEQLRK